MAQFDPEDRNPSLGDPSVQAPVSPAQMKGAMKAQVNRTQLPAGRGGPPGGGKPDAGGQQAEQQSQQQAQEIPGVQGAEQLGGAVGKGMDASKQQADQTLGLDPRNSNPFSAADWLKHAAESPVESYYFGKHIYNAFYGAFLDPGAISASVHDIWHQDNAVSWALKNVAFRGVSEDVAAGGAGMVLPITADPMNVLYGGMAGARGAALVAKMLGPVAISAIFADRHSASDLAWGVLPALLFGGKLPPSVAAQVERLAPGAVKVLDRLSAAKMAQDANKTGLQDRQQLLDHLLRYGNLAETKTVLAKAWDPAMKPLSKEEESALGKRLMAKYGTLDRDKLVPLMIKDGANLQLVQKVWTKLQRMPYDLLHHAPGEEPLVNWNQYMTGMPDAAKKEIREGQQWGLHMVNQAAMRTAGHAADPAVSRFRSLIGLQQTNHLVTEEWKQHLLKVGGEDAVKESEQQLLTKALEGDNVAYHLLSKPMMYVRDQMRMVAAGLGEAGAQEGTIAARVPHYWPRVGLLVKEKDGFRAMRGSPSLLTSSPIKHRAVGVVNVDLLTETRMQVEQLYKTVAEANQAVARHRAGIADAILDGTPAHELENVPETDHALVEQIQAMAAEDMDTARFHAEEYARELIPEFSTNPFDGIDKIGRDLRAITSRVAVNDLLQAVGKGGKALAVMAPKDSRAREALGRQGYRAIKVSGFGHVLVDDQYGKLLEQATRKPGEGFPAWLRRIANVEGAAVAMIMYSPRIHGMNMAARLGTAFAMHPQEISRWFGEGLLQKGGLSQFGLKGVTQIGHEEYRMIPRRYGLVPPNPEKGVSGFAEGYINKIGDLFGDTDIGRTPLLRDMAGSDAIAKGSSGAKAVLGTVKDLAWGRQSDLWSWVSDFGNMMWWIEYAAARRGGTVASGLEHEEAARYATARANSWMGHVSPVDTNPNLQAALKTVTFAPNWWRTWGELLTGYYRNQGFGWSANTIKYVVENEIKTAAAALLFQQLSANAMNIALSGHTIYQNDPGNWGKVEITAPWATAILNELFKLKLDPKTGRDAKGAKLTMENPLARQMTDTEQLMGLLTTSPNWSPETLFRGAEQFSAARLSPVASAIAALGNIDLYRSVSSGGTRYVDPTHDSFAGSPWMDLLAAGGDLTPFAYISQQVQQAVMQGGDPSQDVQGPFGLPIPKVIADTFNPAQVGQDLARSFMVGMTGVNPPYMRSSKTFGVSPTDDAYKSVHEEQTQYEQHMNALSTATLGGQMAPYQWLATYRQLSAQHAAAMQYAFKHAPEYNNGPLGLTSSWEGLYDQATDKQGVLQPDRLRALQREWRANHSQADYAAVQSELHANDQKYPMLALYHKTLDAYDNWQADWAQANNVDVATLQSDLSGYAAVYNDRNASRAWLASHPDIAQFEAAKKSEFESGQSHYGMAGLMYALFFNPTAADRYLLTSGETAQEIEQQTQQEQVPAAP